jgi:hypothetical protein
MPQDGLYDFGGSPRLKDLVLALDGMGPKPTMIELAAVLENDRLTYADVEPYVHANSRITIAPPWSCAINMSFWS